MKKILSTTLVALAFVAVSTVDAKRMMQRGKASQPAAVANVVQAAKMAEENPNAQTKADLATTIDEEADTAAKQDVAVLKIEEQKILDGIKIVKERQKELGGGLFGFLADKDTKKARSAAQDRLNQLNDDLRDVQAKIKANMPDTGSKWASAMDYAIKTAKYIGMPAIVIGGVTYELYYHGTSRVKAMMGYGAPAAKKETAKERFWRSTRPVGTENPAEKPLFERSRRRLGERMDVEKGV